MGRRPEYLRSRVAVGTDVVAGDVLDREGEPLSPHIASRQEVGRILGSGISTIDRRGSIVIGSGSPSFELVCSRVERLPAMVKPSWVDPRRSRSASRISSPP
jgi:hypothetical protein